MEENRTIKRYLILNILILLSTPLWFEGLMGFNRKLNSEYGYGGKFNYKLSDGRSDSYTSLYNDYEPVVFPISVIIILLLAGLVNYRLYNLCKAHNWIMPAFKFDFVFRICIVALSAFTIYQFNLTDFWDDNIVLYRIMYLLTLILPIVLIYEFVINKGATVFPELSHQLKQKSMNSDEEKLAALKNLNIISNEKYSEETKKINKEKALVEIRNTQIYREYVSNLDFALSKGLINEKEKRKKLLEKEEELLSKNI